MNKFSVFAFLVAICLHPPIQGAEPSAESAPSTQDILLLYTHRNLINPWMATQNPASHLFFEAQDRISQVSLRAGLSEDPIRRAMDPGETRQIKARTETLQSIGKLRVRGLFEYQNQHYRDLLYNGNMDFSYTNLYMLGDTIGGKQRQEGYLFEAEGAYPLFDDRLYIGMSLDYETSVGAKMQDLRNSSTIARIRLTPGLIYNHGPYSAGISGGLTSKVNYVHVRAVLDERHTLFYHMGMGHYTPSSNFSGTESVRYEQSGYHAGVQLAYKKDNLFTLHTLQYLDQQMNALTGGSTFRLNNGISDFDRLSYYGLLSIEAAGHRHRMEAQYNNATLFATEVRQESRSINRDGLWVQEIRDVRRIPGKHIVKDLSGELTYHFIRLGAVRPLRYQITASVGANSYSATHYPRETNGFYDATGISGSLSYAHCFRWGKLDVDPSLGFGARLVLDNDAVFMSFPNYMEQIPELDYRYLTQSAYMAELGISFSSQSVPGLLNVFLDIQTGFAYFYDLDQDQRFNRNFQVALGFLF